MAAIGGTAGVENREMEPKKINLGSTGINGSLVRFPSLIAFQV
jgi:hypothetical protein